MKSFTLFSINGIDLKISQTLQMFLMIVFGVIVGMELTNGFLPAILFATVVLSVFILVYSFVIIHEYGHALTAQYLGYFVCVVGNDLLWNKNNDFQC